MSSIWNDRITISYFGDAQSLITGVTISNLPSGEMIDAEDIVRFMVRRSPETCPDPMVSTATPRIISGVLNDRTTGEPLCALFQNKPSQPDASASLSPFAQPGHADYTGTVRYKGYNDVKERSRVSERITAPLCFAGAVCGQILGRRGIHTGAHILQLHHIKDNPFDRVALSRDSVLSIRDKAFPVINDRKGWQMAEDLEKARQAGETLGGIVECAAVNVPAGIGSPVFDGLGSTIARLIFSIPGVRGVEFGAGFKAAKMLGRQNTDEFYLDERGHVLTKTNNHGGTIGGISTGMPITLDAAFDPPAADGSSPVSTVPGAVPCVEAAVNIALLDHMIDYPNFC